MMMSEQREMTLDEWVNRLPEFHLANKQYRQLQKRIAELEAQVPKWISVEDRLPDVLEVRIKLADGSEVNCWAQSDGDFYWKGGGSEVFISEHQVTHWMPLSLKEQDDG